MSDITSIIERRRDRWRRFYDKQAAPSHLFQITPPYSLPYPHPNHNYEQRQEWTARAYEDQLEWTRRFEDDRIPSVQVHTGTEIFAEAFGCRVHRPETDMPFALPLVDNGADAAKLRVPELSNSTLAKIFEMADEQQRRFGPDALFMLPDMQSPLDIAALIWDKNTYYSAMIEEPEAVLELQAKCEQLMCAFLDEWFKRYGHAAYIAHYPLYYMEGGLTLSEDEIGSISPEMFRTFALPALNRLSDRYGGIGIHCCANSRHQWDNLKLIRGVRMLNLIQPDDIIIKAYRFFADFACQTHSYFGAGEPKTWPSQAPAGTRILFENIYCGSIDDAVRVAEEMGEALGR